VTTVPGSGVGLELVPNWTPSMNPRLARFDAVVKVAAGAQLAAGIPLRVRLLDDGADDPVVRVSAELDGLTGPDWRTVSGRLIEVEPAVAVAEGLLAGRASRPVLRRDAVVPVSLTAIRDVIGVAREPHLWSRYYNATGRPVDVAAVRAKTLLWVDGRWFGLTTNYDGPAQLAPGRALIDFWSFDALDGVGPGTYRMQLSVGDETSAAVVVEVGPGPGRGSGRAAAT
jgi:hypothetical protein